jgi:hypothetical protein
VSSCADGSHHPALTLSVTLTAREGSTSRTGVYVAGLLRTFEKLRQR